MIPKLRYAQHALKKTDGINRGCLPPAARVLRAGGGSLSGAAGCGGARSSPAPRPAGSAARSWARSLWRSAAAAPRRSLRLARPAGRAVSHRSTRVQATHRQGTSRRVCCCEATRLQRPRLLVVSAEARHGQPAAVLLLQRRERLPQLAAERAPPRVEHDERVLALQQHLGKARLRLPPLAPGAANASRHAAQRAHQHSRDGCLVRATHLEVA